MKKTILVVSLLASLSFPCSAQDTHPVYLGSYKGKDGITGRFFAAPDTILKIPEWNDDTTHPPLQLLEAISLAKARMEAKYPECDDFRSRRVFLQKVLRHDQRPNLGDRWYYGISFQSERNKEIPYPFVMILMDGTIIEPDMIETTIAKRIHPIAGSE